MAGSPLVGTCLAVNLHPQLTRKHAMESRVRFLGHPVHQMLVVFPAGLLTTSVVFDIIHLATDNPVRRMMIGNIVGADRMGAAISIDVGISNASRVIGPLLVTLALEQLVRNAISPLFFLAIMLSASYGGLGPALLFVLLRRMREGLDLIPLAPRHEIDLAAAWRLSRVLKTFKPEVVHAHDPHAVAMAVPHPRSEVVHDKAELLDASDPFPPRQYLNARDPAKRLRVGILQQAFRNIAMLREQADADAGGHEQLVVGHDEGLLEQHHLLFRHVAGAEWAVTSDFKLRGTRALSTRAPNINELFQPPQQTFPADIVDPCEGVTSSSSVSPSGSSVPKPKSRPP